MIYQTIIRFRWFLLSSIALLFCWILILIILFDPTGLKPEGINQQVKITIPNELKLIFEKKRNEFLDYQPSKLTLLAHRLRMKQQDEFHLELLDTLTSASKFEEKYNHAYPIFQNDEGYVFVLEKESSAQLEGERHRDQLLCAFAEADVPISTRLDGHFKSFSIDDLIGGCRYRGALGQELEWTIVALCQYCSGPVKWENKFGESISLEILVTYLLDQSPDTACFGAHRLYAMACSLHANKNSPGLLSNRVASKVKKELQMACFSLLKHQSEQGFLPPVSSTYGSGKPYSNTKLSLNTRISVTGHNLEWLYKAQEFVDVDSTCVRRAIIYLILKSNDVQITDENFAGFSHAINGLSKWL